MAKKPRKLSDQIRRAVADSGMSQNAISQAIGVDRSTLSRFMRSERGLRLTELDALAAHLNLEVRIAATPKEE